MIDVTRTISEAARVESWRLKCFIDMGAPVLLAEKLARSKADPHEYRRLRERGCSAALAAEILL